MGEGMMVVACIRSMHGGLWRKTEIVEQRRVWDGGISSKTGKSSKVPFCHGRRDWQKRSGPD